MSDPSTKLPAAVTRHWGWLMAALALAALVGGSYYLAGLQPRPPAPVAVHKVLATDPVAVKLAAEVEALEKAYHAAADATPPDTSATAFLEQAVQKQRQLVNMLSNKDDRPSLHLKVLEDQLEVARAEDGVVRVDQLELEGRQALAAGNFDEALPKLQEAYRLQHAVNAGRTPAIYKNSNRESDLDQAVAVAATEPLHQEMQALLAAAKTAETQNDPALARADLVKARALQGRINREHPTSPYANAVGGESIDAEIETLGAEDLRNQSLAAEQEGDRAQLAARWPEAADAFELARAKQQEINEKFKHSDFVSLDRITALEIKRQTAASSLTADLLAVQERAITEQLRLGQPVVALPQIAEAARTMDKLVSTYPKSGRLDPALKTRLDFLAARSASLVEIHRLVHENLRPLPGLPGRLLLRTEVTQALYQLVTGDTPSRNPGAGFPVDSVSWFDAQIFCTRLSWLLGLATRLPDESEFRAALGAGAPPGAWSHENSPTATQPAGQQGPNAAGFSDLLGNVAEWLAADAAGDQALVAGGSYLDSKADIQRVPVESHPKNDRARYIGFRILVEQPLTLPAVAAPAAAAAPNLTGDPLTPP